MNKLDETYQNLVLDILENGVEKSDRTGTGTISVFGRMIRHKMSDGFPLLTTKKIAFKTMAVELLWFLKGDTNIKYLVDNNCYIWVGDSYKNYISRTNIYDKICFKTIDELKLYGTLTGPLSESKFRQYTREEFIEQIKESNEFAEKWGELGPIYGHQWIKWGDTSNNDGINQIYNLINDLKYNPDSRRLMVNAWNVKDIVKMILPPCHFGFQCYTRDLSFEERLKIKEKKFPIDTHDLDTEEKLNNRGIPKKAISLEWSQRSVDVGLGLPFNIASYGLLLLMIADELNMYPDELIGSLGDTHIYKNHVDGLTEQLMREPYELPTVHVRDGIYCSSINDVILENYRHHPAINLPLSN